MGSTNCKPVACTPVDPPTEIDPMAHDALSIALRNNPTALSAWAQTSRGARAAVGNTQLASYCTDFTNEVFRAASAAAAAQCLMNMEDAVLAYAWTTQMPEKAAVEVHDVGVRFTVYQVGATEADKVTTPWVTRSGVKAAKASSSRVVTLKEMSKILFKERNHASFSCDVYLKYNAPWGLSALDVRVGGPRFLAGADVAKMLGKKLWTISPPRELSLKVTFKTRVGRARGSVL
jgi:hypothetical protein